MVIVWILFHKFIFWQLFTSRLKSIFLKITENYHIKVLIYVFVT